MRHEEVAHVADEHFVVIVVRIALVAVSGIALQQLQLSFVHQLAFFYCLLFFCPTWLLDANRSECLLAERTPCGLLAPILKAVKAKLVLAARRSGSLLFVFDEANGAGKGLHFLAHFLLVSGYLLHLLQKPKFFRIE